SVIKLISTADASYSLQHHKVEYKESEAATWTTAFDCWDIDLDTFCDSNGTKSIASFSVNIGSFASGEIQYRSQATDALPSTGYSSVKSFTTINQPPFAAMSCEFQNCAGPGCICNGAWLTYNGDGVYYNINNTSTDPDNNITTSTWSIIGWQDPWITCGSSNPLCNMVMPRISAATYTVQLKVEDAEGLSDIATTSIQVKQDIIADFECSLSGLDGTWLSCASLSFKPYKGQIVYFKDNSSPSEGGGPIISRTWEKDSVVFLGGNSSFASTTLTQTYTTIKLTIKDSTAGGGRSDFQVYTIPAKSFIPKWKEIVPFW
ncbi:hypothetical protein L6279_03410, partial [Candidatus Parcubacteria bacterium]|nr:hypothetical protein [Candidatus Parcubacteria bacterium]